MILCLGLGAAAQAWLHVQSGLLIGLLVGFVAANLVPARGGGCRVSYEDPPPRTPADTTGVESTDERQG